MPFWAPSHQLPPCGRGRGDFLRGLVVVIPPCLLVSLSAGARFFSATPLGRPPHTRSLPHTGSASPTALALLARPPAAPFLFLARPAPSALRLSWSRADLRTATPSSGTAGVRCWFRRRSTAPSPETFRSCSYGTPTPSRPLGTRTPSPETCTIYTCANFSILSRALECPSDV